uniref:Actin cytoskeleton-regulatory complex protein END3 n=1 Tax=Anthurium amnicola TaxID=1678845 RepID=A0A1D1XDZ7_9ARAE
MAVGVSMEGSQQAWRMRFSYRNATIIVCFFNLVAALLLLRGFLAAAPNRRESPGQPDPELLRYILESEEIRRAMEPLQLIKRLRELEHDIYTEPETVHPIVPKKTAAADISKRLQDFRAMNDANNQKALEEWRKRKIERERARQRETEKNATMGS